MAEHVRVVSEIAIAPLANHQPRAAANVRRPGEKVAVTAGTIVDGDVEWLREAAKTEVAIELQNAFAGGSKR